MGTERRSQGSLCSRGPALWGGVPSWTLRASGPLQSTNEQGLVLHQMEVVQLCGKASLWTAHEGRLSCTGGLQIQAVHICSQQHCLGVGLLVALRQARRQLPCPLTVPAEAHNQVLSLPSNTRFSAMKHLGVIQPGAQSCVPCRQWKRTTANGQPATVFLSTCNCLSQTRQPFLDLLQDQVIKRTCPSSKRMPLQPWSVKPRTWRHKA